MIVMTNMPFCQYFLLIQRIHMNKTYARTAVRKEQKSYTQRYRQKGKNPVKLSPSSKQVEESQVKSRVFEHISGESSLQNIRIEQQVDEYQIMKNQFMQTEIMWCKKISETRTFINQLKENIKIEQKVIKQIERSLTNKRIKLATLQAKNRKSNEVLDSIPLENYQQYINSLQEEYNQIDEIGEKQIGQANKQCEELQDEINLYNKVIQQIEQENDGLSEYQSVRFNSTLTSLLQEEERLKKQLAEMEREIEQLTNNLRDKQSGRPIKQEVHRKYLQLYEKMFINKELDVMQSLIQYKQEEIQHFEDYGQRKHAYKQKRKQIEEVQARITIKKNQIMELQQQVRERSTILLNLYQMESLKK